MLANIVVFSAALIVFSVALILVFHPEYEDGFVGRLALGMICFAAFARFVGVMETGFDYDMTKPGLVLWCGVCLFMCRHLFRFLRWKYRCPFDWRPAKK